MSTPLPPSTHNAGSAAQAGTVMAVDRAAAVPTAATRAVPFMNAGPLRILFVDDNHLVREAMRDCLALLGHEVAEAASAEDALQQLTGHEFDVLMSDLNLPGLSGLELARRVARTHP